MLVKAPKKHRVAFRVTAEQKQMLRKAAQSRGNTVSDYVLRLVLDKVQPDEFLQEQTQLGDLTLEQRKQIAMFSLDSKGPNDEMKVLLSEGRAILGFEK
jgi:uncharacterized protein (DUF1778 family)